MNGQRKLPPETRRKSKRRTSSSSSARRKGSTWRRWHTSCGRWPSTTTWRCRSTSRWRWCWWKTCTTTRQHCIYDHSSTVRTARTLFLNVRAYGRVRYFTVR